MKISDEQFRIDKRSVEHLIQTIYQRCVADQTARVCSVQPLHQTLT